MHGNWRGFQRGTIVDCTANMIRPETVHRLVEIGTAIIEEERTAKAPDAPPLNKAEGIPEAIDEPKRKPTRRRRRVKK